MLNGEMHYWYQSVFGSQPDLIASLIRELGASNKSVVFDPFCGTGTTNVECKSRLIKSIGTDVNPVALLASQVKTTWNLDFNIIDSLSKKILASARRFYNRTTGGGMTRPCSFKELQKTSLVSDTTYKYMDRYGMFERGWIDADPLLRTLALKRAIFHSEIPKSYKNLLLLALINTVRRVSNIRFGPELYCRQRENIPCAFSEFQKLINRMADDLRLPSKEQIGTPSYIFEEDARELPVFRNNPSTPNPDIVITSPPYPTEHDYTRNSRLELAFLEAVIDLESLRKIKKAMIRSNSKCIYRDDDDGKYVKNISSIKKIIAAIKSRAKDKKYAFAKMYPLIIYEYFGGMFRHFRALSSVLKQGAKCVYIVGDQSSYLSVYIPTAELLADIIQNNDIGLRVDQIIKIRDRQGTTGAGKNIAEKVLFISKDE